MIKSILRYWNTVKYLKIKQIIFRIFYKVYKPNINLKKIPNYKRNVVFNVQPITKKRCYIGDGNFEYLSQVRHFSETGWNNDRIPKLWMYNLNYFDFLLQDSSEKEVKEMKYLLSNWVDNTKHYRDVGWDPYPTSLRIVNCVKWLMLGNSWSDKLRDSLVSQIRFLNNRIEWHIDGNHLIANAKALIFSGALFDGDEAQAWLRKGNGILKSELDKQILSDGAHYELSPMYQTIILEDLLDIINLQSSLKHCDKDIDYLITKAERMLRWLSLVIHPDGKIPHFNDASCDAVINYMQLESYAEKLKVSRPKAASGVHSLPDSGYITSELGESFLIVDAGEIGPPHQPGHGHADTLSFELSIYGERLFVNAGVSTYELCAIRSEERGSSSHNTVEINGCSSSDVWASFRVGRRASIIKNELAYTSKQTRIEISHSGYKYMKGSPVHCRSYMHTCNELIISDTIIGECKKAYGRLHIHPNVCVSRNISENSVILKVNERKYAKVYFLNSFFDVQDFDYSSNFGCRLSSKCLVYRITNNEANMIITWGTK
ncbi:heparinase II/III family protein [Planktomarina sp.]|nr:heparinase II/III family protein [Planktomarina sp.]